MAATLLATSSGFVRAGDAPAFEGEITAVMTRGSEPFALLYTVGPTSLRIEITGTDRPTAANLVDRETGARTLLFPHNRSFVRVPPAAPLRDPGIAPPRPHFALPTAPGVPPIPAMPMMPPAMKLDLMATGEKKKMLGLDCEKYEVKQRGQTLEIWATVQLFPFHAYLQNQRSQFGARMIEEQWPEMLAARKLFPIRAVLRVEPGGEEPLFEVKSITAKKIPDESGKLFSPPPDYFEGRALPF